MRATASYDCQTCESVSCTLHRHQHQLTSCDVRTASWLGRRGSVPTSWWADVSSMSASMSGLLSNKPPDWRKADIRCSHRATLVTGDAHRASDVTDGPTSHSAPASRRELDRMFPSDPRLHAAPNVSTYLSRLV